MKKTMDLETFMFAVVDSYIVLKKCSLSEVIKESLPLVKEG